MSDELISSSSSSSLFEIRGFPATEVRYRGQVRYPETSHPIPSNSIPSRPNLRTNLECWNSPRGVAWALARGSGLQPRAPACQALPRDKNPTNMALRPGVVYSCPALDLSRSTHPAAHERVHTRCLHALCVAACERVHTRRLQHALQCMCCIVRACAHPLPPRTAAVCSSM